MGKYIDTDTIHWHDDGWACIRKDEYPTIDVVRCKECKYWRNKDPQQIPTASIMCGHMHPDDFCSYGERSE